MSAPEEATRSSQQVRELREQLEEEKRARKRVQNDKVREMKAAREKEQDTARETVDALKMKLLREKTQEMTALQERMTKDFKTQMKETQRKHEEEKQRLHKEMERERRNFKEQRKIIEKEVQKQMQQLYNTDQKKTTHEMFTMASQITEMEERLKDCQAADRTKAELIRQMKAEHQAELESYSHSSKLSSRQQLVELEASRRDVKERDKEISANLERIRRLDADKDRLEEEVRRLRRAESWARSTPAVTPPSLTPSTSAGELTSPHQYTAKERDMVLKNTELSYRVRQLEDQKTELEKYKRELKELLEKAKAEQKPLKEQLSKQSMRVNSLNASLHDKEKLVKKVTEENEELKKSNKELTQEQAQQKKRLTQQMNQTHTQRMEHQRAVGKYTDLQKVCKKLQARVKELELQHRFNSQQPGEAGELECSSSSVSVGNLDTSTSSAGDEGEMEQGWAKYREMKKEYVTMRDHYKKLKSSYDKLEVKYRLAEKERLAMESEVSLLRSSPLNERDSPFDMTRSSIMLLDNSQHLEVLKSRVKELEAFIIEQDGASRLQGEEYTRVVQERDHLQEQLQSMGLDIEEVKEQEREGEREEEGEGEGEVEGEEERGEDEESKLRESMVSDKSGVSDLLQQIGLVEESNLKASAGVKETKEKVKELDDYCKETDETLQSIVTLGDSGGEDEERDAMERAAHVWKKAWETAKKCQELLSCGEDVSPALESLATLLEDQLSKQNPLNDSSLINIRTAHVGPPVDSSTPSVHTHLVAEIGRLRDELSQKQEAVELAQEKVASLQTLVEELERQLEEERNEREELAVTWEEEMATMQSQLSQKEAKLTRQRRAVSQGVNEHMHQQLGHQVLHTLQKCKSLASDVPDSELLVSELCVLETSLHSLLHTVFPGMLQQQTNPLLTPMKPTSPMTELPSAHTEPLSAPTEPPSALTQPPFVSTTEPPLPSSSSPLPRVESQSQSDDEIVVTPISSISSSPTHSLTQLPHLPPLPHTPPPEVSTPPHSPPLSPSHSQVHPHIPTETTLPNTVEEVMVMRKMICEEITIPLSALFETTPIDSTHTEPPPSHTIPKLPFQTSEFHSDPEVHSSTSLDEEHVPISELDNPSDNSSTQLLVVPTEMIHESNEEGEQFEEKQVQDGSKEQDVPLVNGVSPPEIGQDDDVSEVGHTSESVEQDMEKSEEDQTEGWSREGTTSPSLLYSLPPEAPTGGKRILEPTSPLSSTFIFGKKRIRTQSMDQEEMKEEAEEKGKGGERVEEDEKEEDSRPKEVAEEVEERPYAEERLFVAILSYDPEAMCTTGRPEEELFFQEGAIIAVEGSVDDNGFYCGSFQGKRGLVPAGFVQEMEIDDSQQRKRLLNQTLSRPHLPSFSPSPHHTPPSSSRSASSTLFSPSGSLLTHTPFLHHTTALPPLEPPTSVTVETHTREKRVVTVSWTPPTVNTTVTGYHVFVDDQLKASVRVPQTKILLSDVTEDTPVVVGVVSHDRDGQQSSVTAVTYHPPSLEHTSPPTTAEAQPSHSTHSPVPLLTPSHSTHSSASPPSLPTSSPVSPPSQSQSQPEQYRLCIVLYDYDPKKMSPSVGYHLELKVGEGNLLRCYKRAVEDDEYTMAELGESNQRGLVPTSFITEVYGPSATNPQKYEWKSPRQNLLPATSKSMLAMYDYNSKQDSPNRDMELELSFRNGDTITVYGGMDSDGFYTGQMGEAFGLVPSNFLQVEKEEEKKTVSKTDKEEGEGIETWDIPPGMWSHVNGQDLQLDAVAGHTCTASDTKVRKRSLTDDNPSGGESLEGSREGAKRRWSHGLHRPNFKNPFSRKKSENGL